MSVIAKFLLGSLGCLLWSPVAEAVSVGSVPPSNEATARRELRMGEGTARSNPATNPYGKIVERNVFGLRAPPPLPGPPAAVAPAPPRIVLTGITTILGRKLAVMKALLPPAKPGEHAKEEPLLLAEGQREENIEVLKVDEKAGRVTVSDFGTVTNLTFSENGPAPGASSASSPAAPAPKPGSQPVIPPAGANYGRRFMPSRIPRPPVQGTPGAAGAATSPGGYGVGSGSSAGAPSSSAQPVVAPPQASTQATPLTPEEQLILQQWLQEQQSSGAGYQAPPAGAGPPGTLVPSAGNLPAPPRVPLAPQ